VKSSVKSLGLRMAAASGLFAAARYCTRRYFRIFAYHGVSSNIEDAVNFDGFFVRPEVFEAHLRTLKGHYHVMPLGEILRRIHAGETLPDGTAAITFDDGYANNLKEAAPLLAKYGLPATFFVTTGFIDGTHEPWWGTLRERVFSMPDETKQSLSNVVDRKAVAMAWENKLKNLSASERNDTLGQLLLDTQPGQHRERRWGDSGSAGASPSIRKQRLFIDLEGEAPAEPFFDADSDTRHATRDTSSWSMMSWDEVNALTAQGHEIGAHTVSHISLGHESMEVVSREMAESKERIREMTGLSPSVFSYPYGEKEHFSQELADEVVRHGFIGAVTTLEGMNSASDNPLLLRRFNVTGNHDRYAFRALASGLKRW